MGPSAVRIAGLGERLTAMGHTVVDKGNLAVPIAETQDPGDPAKRYIREIAHVCQDLYQSVYEAHAEGALPIVLGGDHSLAVCSPGHPVIIFLHGRVAPGYSSRTIWPSKPLDFTV